MERKYPKRPSAISLQPSVFSSPRNSQDARDTSPSAEFGTKRQKLKAGSLPSRVRGHFFHHGQHQLAVAVVQAGGVAADLAEEADFIIRKLRQALGAISVPGVGEEL